MDFIKFSENLYNKWLCCETNGLENELDKIDLDPFHPAYLGNFDLKRKFEFTSFYV